MNLQIPESVIDMRLYHNGTDTLLAAGHLEVSSNVVRSILNLHLRCQILQKIRNYGNILTEITAEIFHKN